MHESSKYSFNECLLVAAMKRQHGRAQRFHAPMRANA